MQKNRKRKEKLTWRLNLRRRRAILIAEDPDKDVYKRQTPAQHKRNLRNVYGTFAIEGMTISKDTRLSLIHI